MKMGCANDFKMGASSQNNQHGQKYKIKSEKHCVQVILTGKRNIYEYFTDLCKTLYDVTPVLKIYHSFDHWYIGWVNTCIRYLGEYHKFVVHQKKIAS